MHTERRSPCVLKWRITCRHPVIADVIWLNRMASPFDNADQFEKLTKSIATDMQTLAFHWRLYGDLRSSVGEFETELNESCTFWNLTFDAHRDATLFRLCRIYDQHSNALNLRNWLIAMRDNQDHFDASKPMPTTTELQYDIPLVSDCDPEVKMIVRLRNNLIAHRAAKSITCAATAASNCSPKHDDIDLLINRAREVVNKYTTYLNRESFSTTIVGHDDYRNVLESVRARIAQLRNQ